MKHKVVLAAMVAAIMFAQSKPWSPPGTPDGHPDLQGAWTNATLTPLERRAEFRDKPVLSEQEAAAYEKKLLRENDRDRRDGGAEVDVGRAYNELFFERGNSLARVGNSIRTSLIVDPPDGRVPALTPEAQKRAADTRAEARRHPADGPEARPLQNRFLFCAPDGPPMLSAQYNNNYQIVQTPVYVMILAEMAHDARIIPLDGRSHADSKIREWKGDSRGHWEGDTLVVDTTNFTGKTRFRGSSENLHVIERFTRVAADTILYKFTVDDPSTFTKPWIG